MSAKEQLFDIINSSDAVHEVAEGLSDTQRGRKAQKAESRRIRRAERKKEAAKNG